MDVAEVEAAAKGPPAIHRFPAAMAPAGHELATYVATTYDGDAARLWTDASDGAICSGASPRSPASAT